MEILRQHQAPIEAIFVAIGGGGLGDLAITYGYQRFDTLVMVITVAILVILVQGVQSGGNLLSRRVRIR